MAPSYAMTILLAALAVGCGSEDASGENPSNTAAGSGGAAGASGGGGDAGTGADAGPGADTCDGKECGSDHATAEFCGPACPKGQGCSAAGECGAWPPDIDAFYDGNEGWQLPPCDHGDDPGADLSNAKDFRWIKTMTTIATDCPEIIKSVHPMARVGNVVPEDQRVFVNGSCVEYSDGQWGTAFDGVIVWGQSWPGQLDSIEYTISWRAVIDHNLSPPAGKGVAHLTGVSSLDCEIEIDVTYEKCPEHRDDCGGYPVPY